MNACGDARYAASQFAAAPPNASMSLQRRYGAYWLVPMCSPQQQTIAIVAVSALATEMSIGRDSSPAMPMGSDIGEIFFWTGVPVTGGDWVSQAPERSIREVLAATGGLLARQPELVAPDPEQNLPTHAAWHITVEGGRPVATQDGRMTSSTDFSVAPTGDFRAPGTRAVHALLAAQVLPATVSDKAGSDRVQTMLIPARGELHRVTQRVAAASAPTN